MGRTVKGKVRKEIWLAPEVDAAVRIAAAQERGLSQSEVIERILRAHLQLPPVTEEVMPSEPMRRDPSESDL